MTPLDYLQLLRVEAAKQMLTRSLRRVDRISYLVGYSDPGYFKKVFRTRTGMTPSQFRHAAVAEDAADESA
jgi:YesN/AraC family two-component response regulator